MDLQQRYDRLKMGERGAILSIAAYAVLSAVKLIAAFWTGSEALKADGWNNATDIVASVAVLIGLKLARKPADGDHPYGHWKSEGIASLVASFVMTVVGLQVLFEAARKIFAGGYDSPDAAAAWTGALCAAVMYGVYRHNLSLARKTNSQAVMSAAKDNLSDVLVSAGAVVGIVGAQLRFPWLDPLAAVAVGILICRTAFGIFREASLHLSDGFEEETIRRFKQVVLSVEGVAGVRKIQARNYGNNAVVDVTLLIPAERGFREAHEIATKVENALKYASKEVYEVHVHYEPV